ncbi:MAG: hypothetical protein AB7S26_04335 [Sandaracinaceae bacterium]
MKENPRNQGTNSVDLSFLFGMVLVIAFLGVAIYVLGAQSHELQAEGAGAATTAPAAAAAE